MRHPPLFTGIAVTGLILAAAGIFAAAGEPGARSSDPVEVRIPADQVFDGAPGSPGAVVFRHTTHLAFNENRCGGCHVGLFKILKPTRRTSHAEFEVGKSCGACHDEKAAFSVAESCDTCHAGLPENPPAGGRGTP
jgi:c(7)-type cytochrome triheme protein